MTARVLVVDDVDFNVKLLDTKLKQEYYQVHTAYNGREAVEKSKTVQPDIILMDVMMPEMDGFEATKIIKSDPLTAHIPIIMVTALHAQEDKVRGLEAGADDFLTKPIDDHALMTRLKSLVRIKVMTDELRLRDKTGREFGVVKESLERRNKIEGAKVVLVDDDPTQTDKIVAKLQSQKINVDVITNFDEVINTGVRKDYALAIISTLLVEDDGLRLCSMLRSNEILRFVPILIIVDENDRKMLDRGLEMGVSDYLISPMDINELMARCATQIKRKNFQDELKENYLSSITQSITDGLTGLNNRRYFDIHARNMLEQATNSSKPLSLMMLDIDHFKRVNDTYGHPSGDAVLKIIGNLLMKTLRITDLCARYGGEEFVVILPNTEATSAQLVAERIRMIVEATPFKIPVDPGEIACHCSIGISDLRPNDTLEMILHRADQCLYKAKEGGRNQVVIDIAQKPAAEPVATPEPSASAPVIAEAPTVPPDNPPQT